MFVDSHCHLDRLKLGPYNGELAGAIQAAQDQGVSKMLCVAIDLENIQDVLDIAAAYPSVYASVGVHPLSIECQAPSVEGLLELADNEKVVAIGETGLDYYYTADHAEEQQNRFVTQLEVSKQTQKPVIVHTRDAKNDTLAIIKEHCDQEVAGVLHCFTEDWDMAQKAMDMNFYISFSGIVTFKNAVELQEVAKKMPLDRMLIETDSPYLAPVPFRGKSNEPKYVPEVAKFLAGLKGTSVEEIANVTADNFNRLFRL